MRMAADARSGRVVLDVLQAASARAVFEFITQEGRKMLSRCRISARDRDVVVEREVVEARLLRRREQ